MISQNKTRVTVTLLDTLLERIDTVCDTIGMTRSAFIALAAGQYTFALEKTIDKLNKAIESGIDIDELEGQLRFDDINLTLKEQRKAIK